MKKDEFHKLLEKAEINKKEFSDISGVPYPTVLSWGVSRKGVVLEIPNWVKYMVKYYIDSKKLEIIRREICEVHFS